jgi:metal-sulfur cluster biosynthetic enzyme
MTNADLALLIYDVIRDIKDPERPENLAQLGVVQEEDIIVTLKESFVHIRIEFTPTVPHCHLATLIGLCIRVKVTRDFPERHKVLFRLLNLMNFVLISF